MIFKTFFPEPEKFFYVDRPQDLFFATFSKMKAFYDFCNMFLKGSLKMEARFKSVEANVIAGL